MTEPESNVVTRRGEAPSDADPATSSSLHVSVEFEEPIPPTPRSVATPASEETTTLLSAPTPASSFEVETEDRLTRLERKLSLLRGRVESVEAQNRLLRQKPAESPEPHSEAGRARTLGSKQWRLVVLWIFGMSLLAAYGLLK